MNDFDKALKFVLDHEGVFTDDPHDPGGRTNRGITQRTFDEYCHKEKKLTHDVKDLTEDEVFSFYFNLWGRCHCDDFLWPINVIHFDACVNLGISQSTKIMQRILGVVADGIIGPMTKMAEMSHDSDDLKEKMLLERDNFYLELAESKPDLKRYLQGWHNRVEDLRKYIKDNP